MNGTKVETTTGNEADPQGVDHPAHYNKHPSGIEVIEINRFMTANCAAAFKYVVRRREKPEPGMTVEQSTIKNIDKALWYLNDEVKNYSPLMLGKWPEAAQGRLWVFIGYETNQHVADFCDHLEQWHFYGKKEPLLEAISDLKKLREQSA